MTKVIVQINGGRVKARMQNEARLPGGVTAGAELDGRSQSLTSKRAPWVTISTALLPPVVAWLLSRLDRRRHRDRLGDSCRSKRRLADPERLMSTETILRMSTGRLTIRTRSQRKGSSGAIVTGVESPTAPEGPESTDCTLSISRRLLNLMEIRAESAFRPDQPDIELVYALSGSEPNMPDMLHTLSSDTVVEEASENHIISSIHGMIDHINQERPNDTRLIIEVHTHPRGSCHPSEQDTRCFTSAEQTVQKVIPGTRVLFGIHAIGIDVPGKRQEPMKTGQNTIRWSSINREHEIAFYNAATQACEVEIVD